MKRDYEIGEIIYNKSTGKFYKIKDISNNGTIKAYGLYDGKLFWTAWNDPYTVPENMAELN